MKQQHFVVFQNKRKNRCTHLTYLELEVYINMLPIGCRTVEKKMFAVKKYKKTEPNLT